MYSFIETRDIEYGRTGDTPLFMNIVSPDPRPSRPAPALLMIHGGGWGTGSREDMMERARMVARRGYVAASVGYRLARAAPFPAQLHDCKAAIRYLRAHAARHGIDPERIGAWGCSAGGHLAAMLGVTCGLAEFEGNGGHPDMSSAVQTVVDCYGPSDLKRWPEVCNKLAGDPEALRLFGPSGPDKNLVWQAQFSLKTDTNLVPLFEGKGDDRADWASPLTYASRANGTTSFLLVHGTQDCWVPLQQTLALADALDASGGDVTLLIKPNMNHDEANAYDDILAWLDRRFHAG